MAHIFVLYLNPAMRLPKLNPDEFTPEQRVLWDKIATGPRGGVRGPYLALLQAPSYCAKFEEIGRFLRYECSVPSRLRELAILVVARRWKAQYEWFAHAPIAAREGVAADVIEAIRLDRAPLFAKNDERVVYEFVRELVTTGFVNATRHQAAQELLGTTATVELVGFVGHYGVVALLLNAFEIGAPDAQVLLPD